MKIINRMGYEIDNSKMILINNRQNRFETIREIAKTIDLNYVISECDRIDKEAYSDPEDAITSSKFLVESTLKWILDEENISYKNSVSLKNLYKEVSNIMNLSPGKHNETMFKTILSGMINILEGLNEIRNEYGDAHGKSSKNYIPETRHAILAVNSARTITEFLLDTYTGESGRGNKEKANG